MTTHQHWPRGRTGRAGFCFGLGFHLWSWWRTESTELWMLWRHGKQRFYKVLKTLAWRWRGTSWKSNFLLKYVLMNWKHGQDTAAPLVTQCNVYKDTAASQHTDFYRSVEKYTFFTFNKKTVRNVNSKISHLFCSYRTVNDLVTENCSPSSPSVSAWWFHHHNWVKHRI